MKLGINMSAPILHRTTKLFFVKHFIANVFSVVILQLTSGCSDGSAPPQSSSPLLPTPSSSSSGTCAATNIAKQYVMSQSIAMNQPPVEHLIIKLKNYTEEATLKSVIQRALTQWGHFPHVGGPLNVLLDHTMSNDAAVLSLGQRLDVVDATTLAQIFAADPTVEYAEPDLRMSILDTPNDPEYGQQWYLFDRTAGIDMAPAWGITKGTPTIITAVLDTGYRPHADLSSNLVSGYSFITDVNTSNNGNSRGPDATDPGDWVTQAELNSTSSPFYHCASASHDSTWHGTRVAGIIGATANNAIGITGVSWFGKIQPVRVLGKCGGVTSDIADAMRWAAGIQVVGVPANRTPAKIINLSLGGIGTCSQTFQQAIDDVSAKGVTVVVAAGNDGQSTSQQQPANCKGVIAVGANDATGRRASFSNFGSDISISAPGINILSTSNTGMTTPAFDTYEFANGTSLAAPQVSGVVALMLAVQANLTPEQIQQTLRASARAITLPASTPCADLTTGSGILDADASLTRIVPQ